MHEHTQTLTPALATASTSRIGTGAALGAIAALATNSFLFVVGNRGSDIEVVTGWAPDGAPLTYGELVATTVGAVLAGAALLWLLARWSGPALRRWSVIAAAVAVVSAVPLWRLDVDSSSKLFLTLMHLATGACVIGAQHLSWMRSQPGGVGQG